MDALSDRISSFTQEVLIRFADELPTETFDKVSDIMLRELQYQQIQEKIYVPLKKFLEELQNNSQTQKKIVKRMDTMLAGNVQQLQRDEKQIAILTNLKEEQVSLEKSLKDLNDCFIDQFNNNILKNIKSEALTITTKISEKVENLSLQNNKDNANISNQITMLVEIHKQFMEEFKNNDVGESIDKVTKQLCELQEDSLKKVSSQIENIPELIQSEIMEAIDSQEILNSLKDQQVFISDKFDEHLEKSTTMPSIEESQILLQPIQDVVVDQNGHFEEMLENIQKAITSLENNKISVENDSELAPVIIENLEQQVSKAFTPIMSKMEDVSLENIRPKDLDIMKKSLAKMLETGFWRIEQLVENNMSTEKEIPVRIRDLNNKNNDQLFTTIEKQLEKIEIIIQKNASEDIKSTIEKQLQQQQEYLQAMANNVEKISQKDSKWTIIEEKLSNLNVIEKKIDDMSSKIVSTDEQYINLQTTMANLEEKFGALALKIETKTQEKTTAICPHCTKEVVGLSSMAGQRVKCKYCYETFTFPKI